MKTILNKYSKAIAIAAFVLSASSMMIAQDTQELLDMSLEDLMNLEVTTASKKAESLSDAPGIISVISRQEIDGFYAQNLGQVLSKIVGANFLTPDVFANNALVIRGQESTPYNNHVLILVNGRPFRDPLTGGLNSAVYSGFPINIIDHIEIIRGPGSVLYGSCAYSGVVNIITTDSRTNNFKAGANIKLGNQESISGSGGFSYASEDLRVALGIYSHNDRGPLLSFFGYEQELSDALVADWRKNPDNYKITKTKLGPNGDTIPTNGLVKGKDYFSTRTIGTYGNIGYKEFSLDFSAIDYEPTGLGAGKNFEKGYANHHKSYMADLGYSKDFSENFSVSANYTYNEHLWYTGVGNSISLGSGSSHLFEANIRLVPIENFNMLFGAGYEVNHWYGDIFNTTDLGATFGYVQMDYRFLEIFKLIAGVQANKIENIDLNLSPRVGVIANINENLGAKVLYSTAFRRGYGNETGFNHPLYKGNKELKPEIISTLEAQVFYNTKFIQSNITFYTSTMSDIISRVTVLTPELALPYYFYYKNGGEWKFVGLEGEVKIPIMDNFLLIANAYWQTNTKADTLDNAALHPNVMIKGGLLYSNKILTIGVYNSFFGEPHATSLVNPNSKELNAKAEAYNLLSAKVSMELNNLLGIQSDKSISVFIEGDNLLDKYITYPDYPNKQLNTFIPLYDGIVFNVGMNIKI